MRMSKTSSSCKIEPIDKVSCISLPQFRQRGTLMLMSRTTSTHSACFASWRSQTYIRSIHTDTILCNTIYMHVGIQKSVILREGYTVFYVIQEAKRRIISLRASKSETLSCRMTGRCAWGKDREPFDRMTEIRGFDLQE